MNSKSRKRAYELIDSITAFLKSDVPLLEDGAPLDEDKTDDDDWPLSRVEIVEALGELRAMLELEEFD